MNFPQKPCVPRLGASAGELRGGLAPFPHPYTALEVQSTAPGGIRVPEGQPWVLPRGRFGMRGLHMAGKD